MGRKGGSKSLLRAVHPPYPRVVTSSQFASLDPRPGWQRQSTRTSRISRTTQWLGSEDHCRRWKEKIFLSDLAISLNAFANRRPHFGKHAWKSINFRGAFLMLLPYLSRCIGVLIQYPIAVSAFTTLHRGDASRREGRQSRRVLHKFTRILGYDHSLCCNRSCLASA